MITSPSQAARGLRRIPRRALLALATGLLTWALVVGCCRGGGAAPGKGIEVTTNNEFPYFGLTYNGARLTGHESGRTNSTWLRIDNGNPVPFGGGGYEQRVPKPQGPPAGPGPHFVSEVSWKSGGITVTQTVHRIANQGGVYHACKVA